MISKEDIEDSFIYFEDKGYNINVNQYYSDVNKVYDSFYGQLNAQVNNSTVSIEFFDQITLSNKTTDSNFGLPKKIMLSYDDWNQFNQNLKSAINRIKLPDDKVTIEFDKGYTSIKLIHYKYNLKNVKELMSRIRLINDLLNMICYGTRVIISEEDFHGIKNGQINFYLSIKKPINNLIIDVSDEHYKALNGKKMTDIIMVYFNDKEVDYTKSGTYPLYLRNLSIQ